MSDMKWIPVSERLPDFDELILAFDSNNCYEILKGHAINDDPRWYSHWRALPPAPDRIEAEDSKESAEQRAASLQQEVEELRGCIGERDIFLLEIGHQVGAQDGQDILDAVFAYIEKHEQAERRAEAAEADAGRLDWLESLLLRRAEINDLPWPLRADIHLYGSRSGKGHVSIYLRNEINRNVVEAFGNSTREAIDAAARLRLHASDE